jgi:cobalt-zinc-cadmium efflux system protein
MPEAYRHAPHDQHHDAGQAYGHGHPQSADGHSHGPAPTERGFLPAMLLNLGFALAEALAGLLGGSLALIADAGHNLSDVLGLLIAWGAVRLSRRAPAGRRTYGFHRASILAALANAMLLLLATGAIAIESLQRFGAPQPVPTGLMFWVALVGIAVNAGTSLFFVRGGDVNRRGAFLHLAADAGVSAGVVAGAVLIRWTGWTWVDPALGLLIGAVILVGTWGLLRESLDLAMDAVPRGLDPAAINACLAGLPGVAAVHDLHIWPLSTTETALTAHLVRPGAALDDAFLAAATGLLADRFGIRHATLQVEAGDPAYPCALAPAGTL